MRFYEEKGLALCGLACVLCHQESCPGCKAHGCSEDCDCSVYQCVIQKGIDGCYECEQFPCAEDILSGIRNRAFNRYARQHGKKMLLDRLRINYENGITYHKSAGLKGDYDMLETEDDILRLIGFGSYNPYEKCPVLETEHFVLRLVTINDAHDLLQCYADPKSQELFDTSTCTSDFRYQTINEMQACIHFWLDSYKKREFIRFVIIDKTSERGIGTMEMFSAARHLAGYEGWGVLRIDLASSYETKEYLNELLSLSNTVYYSLMGVNRVVTKAIPAAKARITELLSTGFIPFEWPEPGREHYWVRDIEYRK